MSGPSAEGPVAMEPEPPVGSVILDADGRAWQRNEDDSLWGQMH